MLRNVFMNIVPFMRLCDKCCTAGQATDGSIIRHMHIAWRMPKATNKHSQYVIPITFPLPLWWQERLNITFIFKFLAQLPPNVSGPPDVSRFPDHTKRRTTVGKTPLGEWSARRRDLYLTTHNTHNRQTSMPPAGFEPTISAGDRPQTYALDRAATGTGST
jgi:hypothetical protein